MQPPKTVLYEQLLNRVPEVTVFFWIIKVLGTTIGETAADFLNVNLNLGLSLTSLVMGLFLIIALIIQFRARQYIPSIYWSAVVLISVFGTLVTDNLTDSLGVPLELSTLFFSVALGITFILWYKSEKTLSMHSIVTAKRESFYWLAILFTFALGTASGDLMAEGLGLGYFTTGLIVAVSIATIVVLWKMGLNPVLSFWLVYILTRPLGASFGDLLTQPAKYGGFGLGAPLTSLIFLLAILAIVWYLTITKKDVIQKKDSLVQTDNKKFPIQLQLVSVLGLILVVSGVGYSVRQHSLNQKPLSNQTENAVTAQAVNTTQKQLASNTNTLGDMSNFKTIVDDTLTLVNKNDMSGAKTRVSDLEYEWDNAEATLKPLDKKKWNELDGEIDTVLRQIRAVHPDQIKSQSALKTLLNSLG